MFISIRKTRNKRNPKLRLIKLEEFLLPLLHPPLMPQRLEPMLLTAPLLW
jgi:hypothetical protein